MSLFEITNGPLIEFYYREGCFETTFAKETDCDQAYAYYISITNATNARLWIENIFFRLNVSSLFREHSLLPIYPNRERSYPTVLPVPLGHRLTVQYAVPFKEIPPLVEEAVGICIRYRNYYVPIPIYTYFDYSDDGFLLFLKALRLRNRPGHA